ncbi:MAG: hypothetical protein IKH04_04730 [Kiritimatiellae bacterium]|nr:hypothetical protein [Kiritimatiellia bacterium]
MNRTVTIEADAVNRCDLGRAFGHIGREDTGRGRFAANLDGLHDFLAEFGAGVRLVVLHPRRLSPGARQVLEDTAAEVPGFEFAEAHSRWRRLREWLAGGKKP